MNAIIEKMIRQFIVRFLTKETIDYLAEQAKRAGYRFIDVAIAAIVTAAYAYISRPPDDIILGASYYVLGDTPAEAVGSSVIVFVITSAFRYLGGWSFIIKILSSLFGVALVVLSILMSLPLAACVVAILAVSWKARGAEISGPTQAHEHTIIEMVAKRADGERIMWAIAPWERTSVRYLPGSMIFTAPPGRYAIALEGQIGDQPQTRSTTTIDILPASPSPTPPNPAPPNPAPPGPAPVPPPPLPAPVLPDGQFKLAAWAFNNAKPINDPAGAAALSGAIKGMLAAYAAGTMKASDLLPSLSSAIRERGPKWDDFRKAFAAELNRQGFRTRPPADWVTAGNEVVTGLDAIK